MIREMDERELIEFWLSGSEAAGEAVTAIAANVRTLRRVMREPPNDPEGKPLGRFPSSSTRCMCNIAGRICGVEVTFGTISLFPDNANPVFHGESSTLGSCLQSLAGK